MTSTDTRENRRHQIFISYAQADNEVAQEIANGLRGAGLTVWFDEWALKADDSIRTRIEEGVRASDLLLVLLSPNSVSSNWVKMEWTTTLSRELDARAVTVIPAIIKDCDVPPILASRQYLDLRTDLKEGLHRLIQQLGVVPEIDFSKLTGQSFEKLVAELLRQLGFSLESQYLPRDSGFDFIASFVGKDPFGVDRRESWFVEVKFYKNERVSLQALRDMVKYMVAVAGFHKGLVITNSQLTSVATKFLYDITESGRELRVIDGAELRTLLLRHPDLVERYFESNST